MAYILSSKKSTYGSPYAFYSLDATQAARTPTTVTIKFTAYGALQYSTSTLGTGSGMGLVAGVYVGGSWHTWTLKGESTGWSGTASHSAAKSVSISAGASVSALSASFRVQRSNTSKTSASLSSTTCSNIAITNIANTYANVGISGAINSQAKLTATLSGVPASVGYARTICWYRNGSLIGTTSVAATASATSYAYAFTGLLPSTTYTLKAEIRDGGSSGAVLSTKSVSLTTSAETGELELDAKATYITVDITDMFDTPNYTRSIEVYIKKSEDDDYVLSKTLAGQGTSVSVNITGLASNESYDVKALIKSGTTTLLTLEDSAETPTDTSLIPTGIIENVSQKLGTRECTIEWLVDKSVAGTNFAIQAKTEAEDEWTTLATLSAVESPKVVIAHDGNVDMAFRVASWNYDVVDEVINYSDEYVFYVRDDFVWDTDKVKGAPFIITASEWNRLIEYVVARNADLGITVSPAPARSGDPITAEAYNIMKNAINNISPTGVADKRRGDAITAADIDKLRTAVNATNA